MLLVCEKCKFIFNRTDMPSSCPNCEGELIRDANELEKAEYDKLAKELPKSK